MEVAVLIDGDHGALAGAEFGDGGFGGVEVYELAAVGGFDPDEADMMLGRHGVRNAAYFHAEGAVIHSGDVRDVFLVGAVRIFRVEFLHGFTAADGGHAAVHDFDNDIAAMRALVEFHCHSIAILRYQSSNLALLFEKLLFCGKTFPKKGFLCLRVGMVPAHDI